MKPTFFQNLTLFAAYLLLLPQLAAHEPGEEKTGAAKKDAESRPIKVLIYSNTAYYRHPEVPAINRWLVITCDKHGIEADVSEHWKDLRPKELSQYDVLLLNN